MIKIFIGLLLILPSIKLISQSETEIALQKTFNIYEGLGKEKAFEYIDSLYKLTQKSDFMYQKALIFYSERDFSSAVPVLEKIKRNNDTKEEYFQLLGSCYDFIGQKNKCIFVLNEGLVRFPKSGRLHYELGNAEIGRKERETAVTYWEKGISVEPSYANNYYRLCKYYAPTQEKLISLIYGESFLNISTSTQKKQEISKLIYEIYTSLVKSKNRKTLFPLSDLKPSSPIDEISRRPFIFRFQERIYESLKSINESQSELRQIIELRSKFLKDWDESGFSIHYPIALVDYQLNVINKADFEAYSYIIFNAGNVEEFQKWAAENQKRIYDQAVWMEQNPLIINDSNSFFKIKFREE